MTAPELLYRADWLEGNIVCDGVNIWSGPSTKYRRADLPPTDAQIMAHPKVRALVEAVKFYADENNHDGHFDVGRQRCDPSIVDHDNGDTARAALARFKGETE